MDLSQPYGYRARIGSISPAAISETKPLEFYQAAPPGTTIAFAESTIEEMDDSGQVERAIAGITDGARALARTQVDYVVIAGAPLVVLNPPEFEDEIIAEVAAAIHPIPVTTSQRLELEALRHLGIERVVVASPWGDRINLPLKAYLERAGLTVIEIAGAGVPMAVRGKIGPGVAGDLGRRLLEDHPDADGLYLACPNWPTLPAAVALETESGRPVLSPIQAFIWYPLIELGAFAPVEGQGRLLGPEGAREPFTLPA